MPTNLCLPMEPTFSYLDKLSGSNREFKLRIIKLILTELPKDFDLYQYALSLNNQHWAAEIVHRIKQKISFFQMTEALKLADLHEMNLREGKMEYVNEFSGIVNKILTFLENSRE